MMITRLRCARARRSDQRREQQKRQCTSRWKEESQPLSPALNFLIVIINSEGGPTHFSGDHPWGIFYQMQIAESWMYRDIALHLEMDGWAEVCHPYILGSCHYRNNSGISSEGSTWASTMISKQPCICNLVC